MPTASPVPVAPPASAPVNSNDVRSAIARASQSTGVDFDYLLAQAKLESGLDPDARARTSSATGLYQFIDSTWLRTMDRHGDKYGYGWAADQIGPGGGVANRGTRDQLLSLRYNADVSALMAAELARDNANGLRGTLGREPEPAELYLAHFLGLGGAQKFLGAYQSNGGQSAVALMPKAAAANRPIFYDNGRPRSVSEVMSLMQTKVAGAMEGGGMPFVPGAAPGIGGIPEEFAAARYASTAMMPGRTTRAAAVAAPSGPQARPSMADTLRATFGGGAGGNDVGGRAMARVDAAYAKFAAFGL